MSIHATPTNDGALAVLARVVETTENLAVRMSEISKGVQSVHRCMERGDVSGAHDAANRLDALAESLSDAQLTYELTGRTGVLRAYCSRAAKGA